MPVKIDNFFGHITNFTKFFPTQTKDELTRLENHVTPGSCDRFTHGAANAEAGGIQRLPHRWQRVVIVTGDYNEDL
ncbi:hypothetical protein TNCV_4044251 [Trichonephila clavipes]|nr:hypothetical protein TNCV_4044251 [Trichonephila clavipes]